VLRQITKRSSCREDRGSTAHTVNAQPASWPAQEDKLVSTVQGKVKFFDHDRGFGFIGREGGDDVFVHVSNLQADGSTLTEGQTVEFEIGPGRKSEEAKNVRSV
jgi:CspA family cold shock protein